MDGTLIDSGEYHWLAWRETLAREGHVLTRDAFTASFGQRNDAILRQYFGIGISTFDVARIGDAKEEAYRQLIRARGIELLPGVRQWLHRLSDDEWRQAVASSAPPENIDLILNVLGVRGCFQAIVSAADVSQGKPAPEVFLVAAERLAVPPSRCVVVEDAPAGIEAGRRGGMKTIGLASMDRPLDADVVVTSLEALPPDAFDRLIEMAPVRL
jgi:beta-phosphoglucomutase